MKQSIYEEAIETIGQGVEELDMTDEERAPLDTFLETVADSYILVAWPQSQEYLEEEWFEEEAIFCGGSEEKTGDSAYFIPIKRIL